MSTGIEHGWVASGDLEALSAYIFGEGQGMPCCRIVRESYPLWGIDAAWGDEGGEVVLLGGGEHWRALGVSGVHRSDVVRMIRQAKQHNPGMWTLWFWFTSERLNVAFCQRLESGNYQVLCDEIDLGEGVFVKNFKRLSSYCVGGGEEANQWMARVMSMLQQEPITQRFYLGFERARRKLASSMRGGPADLRQREAMALTWLLRLVVLYFLQGRGALASDRWFLGRRLAQAQTMGGDLFEEVIKPLCFGALSLQFEDRAAEVQALGAVPFLNGGLFEPSAYERAFPEVRWDIGVWEGILATSFEPYSFELREPLDGVCSTSIDPEMLGKVFESLMCQERRSRTGAYYTPSWLVKQIVSRALSGHVEARLGYAAGELYALFHDGAPVPCLTSLCGDGKYLKMKELADEVESFKVLDPAVGTGAFLLEALEGFKRFWRGLEAMGFEDGVDVCGYGGVRELVHRHLYGVDINVEAVRLCELRIWLAMLSMWPEDLDVSHEQMEPLPNLGHRLVVGDSLIGPVEQALLIEGGKRMWAGDECRRLEQRNGGGEIGGKIRRLGRRYLTAHGAEKVELKQELEQVQRAYAKDIYVGHLTRCEHRIQEVEEGRGMTQDLFDEGASRRRSGVQRELLMLYREREVFEEKVKRLECNEDGAQFSYNVSFPEVMEQGGFDVIMTNPPWVRANDQDSCNRGVYARRYTSARGHLWDGARQQGVSTMFGIQVDMAALFLERSLELLKPGGRLGALVPSKLFRSLHGAGVRGVMGAHHVTCVEDFSESNQKLFDAVVYPAYIEVERGGDIKKSTEVIVWKGGEREVHHTSVSQLCLYGNDIREPWVMATMGLGVNGEADDVWALGCFEGLRPRRGVMTGHNQTFFPGRERILDMCGGDPGAYATFSREVIRGRDIRAWGLEPGLKRMLWPYHEGEVLPMAHLPEGMQRHFKAMESALRARSDCRVGEEKYWKLFRLQDGIEGPKVIWRDMSIWAEATCDEEGRIPLNTAYYIPCEDVAKAWLMAVWFNAAVTRRRLRDVAERASNGYRRHFGWVVSAMKIPGRWARWVLGEEDQELASHCAYWRKDVMGVELAERELNRLLGVNEDALRSVG